MNMISPYIHLFEEQARLLKALDHPVRLAIMAELRKGEACVCHLEAHLGYRQSYLSQQLAVLRDAGLVNVRRDGWNIFYQAAGTQVYSLLDVLQEMTGGGDSPALFTQAVDCPCPRCSAANKSLKENGEPS